MKKNVAIKIILLFWSMLALQSLHADEGMWLLPNLNDQVIENMQKRGLELEAWEIYHDSLPALKDAVVIFGGFCTGEIISPKGLLLTNHHCGYEFIQENSTLKNNYLRDGFWAANHAQELPNPNLFEH